jgi:hypothetical protein
MKLLQSLFFFKFWLKPLPFPSRLDKRKSVPWGVLYKEKEKDGSLLSYREREREDLVCAWVCE